LNPGDCEWMYEMEQAEGGFGIGSFFVSVGAAGECTNAIDPQDPYSVFVEEGSHCGAAGIVVPVESLDNWDSVSPAIAAALTETIGQLGG
jgi:hypothetical protein